MKLEYVSDPTLLTRIKRSYSHVRNMKVGDVVATNLFVYERIDCSKVKLKFVYDWNLCLKVTVVLTGKKYVATHRFGFGTSTWTLYQTKGANR